MQFQGALAYLGVGGEFLDDDLANGGGFAEHGGQVPPQRGDRLAQIVIRVGGRGQGRQQIIQQAGLVLPDHGQQ